VFQDQTERSNYLKKTALYSIHESDMLEWYRQQYNLPIDDERFLSVNEDTAAIDFYRRQFFAEIQFGVRDWGDMSHDFLMPPFPTLKQFGGLLPTPKGYGYSDSDTIDKDKISKPKKDTIKKPSIVNESVPDIIKNPVPEGGNIVKKTDVSEYGLGEDEFWNWIEQEEKDLGDDEWDVVESYKPDDKIV